MTKKPKRPRDTNQLAKSIVDLTTGEAEVEPAEDFAGKDPAAVALGRKGGLKGGKARAEKLTAEQRSEIAKKAARTRWRAKSED
ncbi:MAG TPA: histone H1 [Gammaproteobacteria bacterium]|nr:histone H1 [Gammaproteobacteria bacterium]